MDIEVLPDHGRYALRSLWREPFVATPADYGHRFVRVRGLTSRSRPSGDIAGLAISVVHRHLMAGRYQDDNASEEQSSRAIAMAKSREMNRCELEQLSRVPFETGIISDRLPRTGGV